MRIVDSAKRAYAAAAAVSLMTFGPAHAASPRAPEAPVDATQPAEPPSAEPATPTEPTPPMDARVDDSELGAVHGREVRLLMADGGMHVGTLTAFDERTATLILPGGAVQSLDRGEIRGIEVTRATAAAYGPAPPPPVTPIDDGRYRGTGRLITGKVVTSVGVVQSGLGIASLALAAGTGLDDYTPAGVGLLTWGVVHLAVGIPLWVSGKRARDGYDRWNAEQQRTLSKRKLSLRSGPGGFVLHF